MPVCALYSCYIACSSGKYIYVYVCVCVCHIEGILYGGDFILCDFCLL